MKKDRIGNKKKWFEKFEKFWTPGEDMAKTLLKDFIKKNGNIFKKNSGR